MQPKPIHEQVVVLFGASSGIGRATARSFAERGARVVVVARSDDGVESLANEITQQGGQALALIADTSDYAQVSRVAEQVVAHFGRIDTWVHLAAVAVYGNTWETPPEDLAQVISTDLLGQIYGARAAVPHMRAEGGTLIHISSVLGTRGMPLQSAYSAAKHGINGFTEALRLELRHANIPIQVTTIMPSAINTPFFENAKSHMGVKPAGMAPYYQPELVADAILYAAEHPVRDMIVGGAGKVLNLAQRISPQLVDELLLKTAFKAQTRPEPELAEGPHNLEAPLSSTNQTHGTMGPTRSSSISSWLDFNPGARKLLTSTAALGVLLLFRRALEGAGSSSR
jgi:NAD(P)-dependent dehydrogenase (short-subunit alcohol dehydrogenase family)